MDGPDGLLVHLNQPVALLDVSSDRTWEGKAPVCDDDFPWLGRFEQILAHVLQFRCECLVEVNQLLRCNLIGAIEQVGHRFVDLERHAVFTGLSPRSSKNGGAHDDFFVTTFKCSTCVFQSPSL